MLPVGRKFRDRSAWSDRGRQELPKLHSVWTQRTGIHILGRFQPRKRNESNIRQEAVMKTIMVVLMVAVAVLPWLAKR